MPPKKPERLSLQRAASLLSVDQVTTSSTCSARYRDDSLEDRLRQSQMWKSTGDGLNDCNFSDTLSSYSSASSRKVAKRRLEMSSRRESSPLPLRNSSHSDARSTQSYELVEDSKSLQDDLNSTLQEDEHHTCRGMPSVCENRVSTFWNEAKSRDVNSSPSNTGSSAASYHTASSGESPFSSNERCQNEGISRKGPSYNHQQYNSNCHQARSPISNTLQTSPNKLNSSISSTESNLLSNTRKRVVDNQMPSDITLVHAEPTYGYFQYKQPGNSTSPTRHRNQPSSGQTLSYRHNSQKLLGHTNHLSSKVSSSPSDRSNTPSKSKDLYSNGQYSNSVYQTFSSLKRHNGKVENGMGPSTPLTPRSNSSMKIKYQQSGDDEWC